MNRNMSEPQKKAKVSHVVAYKDKNYLETLHLW